jgi:hypothetical protein
MTEVIQAIENGEQIDFARIFRAAANMEDIGKARKLLQAVAAAAEPGFETCKKLARITRSARPLTFAGKCRRAAGQAKSCDCGGISNAKLLQQTVSSCSILRARL